MAHSTTFLPDVCPACKSIETVSSIEPATSIHYARLECLRCGRFIKWLAHPPEHQQFIDTLLATGQIKGWEAFFLRNIRTRRHLSAKQSEKLVQIANRYQLENSIAVFVD